MAAVAPIAKKGRASLEVGREQQALRAEGFCAASRSNGAGWCRQREGWGTDHPGVGLCKRHGGNSPNGKTNASNLEAARAVEQYGLPRDIDPHDALLEELARTAGHVDWLRVKVGELTDEAMTGPVGQSGEAKDGTTHHAEAQPNVWIGMYRDERRHLLNVAQTCVKAGIEERRVKLAEAQGKVIATVIRGVVTRLGVANHPQLARVIREELAMVADPQSELVEGNGREVPKN